MTIFFQVSVAIAIPLMLSCNAMSQELDTSLDPLKRPPLVDPVTSRRYHKLVLEGPFGIPPATQVDEMYVELTLSKKSSVPPFKMPPEYHEKVLALFSGAVIQSDPILSMPEVCSFKIWTKDRRFRRVCIYGGGQLPLNFSIHGIRCAIARPPQDHLDESKFVIELIEEAQRVVEGQQRNEERKK